MSEQDYKDILKILEAMNQKDIDWLNEQFNED